MRIAVVMLGALLTLGQSAAPTPLRQIDWPNVLASDPSLIIDPSVPDFAPAPGDPYVRLANPPRIRRRLGDTRSSTTCNRRHRRRRRRRSSDPAGVRRYGGALGLLVYHKHQPQPRLAAVLGAYKMGARIFNGALLVAQPEYAGFEPNCCPSAVMETHYSLQDQLVPIASVEQPVAESPETVQYFYTLLDQHALSDAYAFLSDSYHQAQPFDTWSSGYATTQHAQVDAVLSGPGGVQVEFMAVDRAPDGTNRTAFPGHLVAGVEPRRAPLGAGLSHDQPGPRALTASRARRSKRIWTALAPFRVTSK